MRREANICILLVLEKFPFIFNVLSFSSPVQIYRKSYCTTPGVGVGVGGGSVDKMLKFYVKVFLK